MINESNQNTLIDTHIYTRTHSAKTYEKHKQSLHSKQKIAVQARKKNKQDYHFIYFAKNERERKRRNWDEEAYNEEKETYK